MTIEMTKGTPMNDQPVMAPAAITSDGDGQPEVTAYPVGGMSMNGQPAYPVGGGGVGVSMNGQPETSAYPVGGCAILPPSASPQIPMREQPKIGAKCCGCCCDYRRACVIVDSVYCGLSAFSLLSLAFPTVEEGEFMYQGANDDAVVEEFNEMLTVNIILSGIGVITYAIPLYGAIKFNIPMLAYGIFWMVAQFIAGVVVGVVYNRKVNDVASAKTFAMPFPNWIIQFIITSLVIYPHAGLIMEINNGIMSEFTYPREEFSCCCGPPGR